MYRFIGNKSKIIDQILPVIRQVTQPGASVVDLMCGTASVSEALRLANYRVIASDLLTFAKYHAIVRLNISKNPSFRETGLDGYYHVIETLNNLKPIEGYFFREFSPDGTPVAGVPPRKYFSSSNAAKIDAISSQINIWNTTKRITEIENALLRHDLVLAINNIANIAGTYGHFRSKWNLSALNELQLIPSKFLSSYPTNHIVLQGPAEEIAKSITADLCYIDPPYKKRQYAANYHVLETAARGDEPVANGVSGLRPWRDQYSDFCSKIKIYGAFEKIITDINSPKILISYSEDGLLPKKTLVDFLSRYGQVKVFTFTHKRFRSNNSELSKHLHEYLFYLEKK